MEPSWLGQARHGRHDFGPQAEVDLTGHIIRWFDYWLKDIDNGVEAEPAVHYFCMGAGAWRTASTWPPEGLGEAVYYLHSEGRAQQATGDGYLHVRPPEGDESADIYVYDPYDPARRCGRASTLRCRPIGGAWKTAAIFSTTRRHRSKRR